MFLLNLSPTGVLVPRPKIQTYRFWDRLPGTLRRRDRLVKNLQNQIERLNDEVPLRLNSSQEFSVKGIGLVNCSLTINSEEQGASFNGLTSSLKLPGKYPTNKENRIRIINERCRGEITIEHPKKPQDPRSRIWATIDDTLNIAEIRSKTPAQREDRIMYMLRGVDVSDQIHLQRHFATCLNIFLQILGQLKFPGIKI